MTIAGDNRRADEYVQLLKRIWTDDVVEFKGKYCIVPASKIGPKPIHKPHIPIYLGGFNSNTFKRIVNFDLYGWLATVGGPLEYLDRSIKDLRDYAEKAKKDPNKFEIITLTFPQIMDSNKPNDKEGVYALKSLCNDNSYNKVESIFVGAAISGLLAIFHDGTDYFRIKNIMLNLVKSCEV